MKKSNWKFFVGIGLLLIIVGIVIFPDDDIIGVIGLLFGIYNLVKGIRLGRGIQPYLIRKQQEKHQQTKDEVRDKINHGNHGDDD